jgi:hypothetical protein
MKWLTRIPTHDNDGKRFAKSVLKAITDVVRDKFGGYSLDGPGLGAWTDDEGMVYEEHSYVLTVLCDRALYTEAREAVIEIGRRLDQKAMYFEVRDVDGVEIISID